MDDECLECFGTGEYFDGKKMVYCSCEAGVKKETEDEVNDRSEPATSIES